MDYDDLCEPNMSHEDWRLAAINRAHRLARLVELGAPEVLIGRAWSMVWQALVQYYGEELFHKGQDDLIPPTNRLNEDN